MIRCVIGGIILVASCIAFGGEYVAPAVADAYLSADGYGGAYATYIKFDLSDLPSEASIDSAFIEVYTADFNPKNETYGGSGYYIRVVDQTWDESTSPSDLYNAETGGSVRQVTGFKADINQKAVTSNVGSLVSEDLGNQYCTIRIGLLDPPLSGNLTVDELLDGDTLAIGFVAMAGQWLRFYSSEKDEFAPVLRVHYSLSTRIAGLGSMSAKRTTNRIGDVGPIYSLTGRVISSPQVTEREIGVSGPYVSRPARGTKGQSILFFGGSTSLSND